MFGMIGRARARLPLTPGERAVLKLAHGLLVTGGIAAILTAGHLLAGSGPVNWQRVAFAAAVSGLVAALNALAKYYTAQGDAPIAEALTYLAGQAQQRAGLNDAKVPISAPMGDGGAALGDTVGAA